MAGSVKKVEWKELKAVEDREDRGIGLSLSELLTVTIDGVPYGARLICLSLFGAPVEAIAVRAGDDKWVTNESEGCQWLKDHGMPEKEAVRLMAAVRAFGRDK